jgi:cytochrome c551/c552
MFRISKLALCGFIVGALVVTGSVAQAQMKVDANLAKRGKSLFANKGCTACHTIGKGKLAGPDLMGVTQRRSEDWLKRWLKDPPAMIGSDSIASAMVTEFKGVKMPNMKLNDSDVMALINYLAEGKM